MFLLSLSFLVLGVGMHAQAVAPSQAQSAAPPQVVVTNVMAMLTVKPGVPRSDVMRVLPEEVRQTALVYLDGKIEQWYGRADGRGVVIILRCKTVEEAKAIMESLPLHKAGYVDVDYIPVGPLSPLRLLTKPQAPSGGAGTQ